MLWKNVMVDTSKILLCVFIYIVFLKQDLFNKNYEKKIYVKATLYKNINEYNDYLQSINDENNYPSESMVLSEAIRIYNLINNSHITNNDIELLFFGLNGHDYYLKISTANYINTCANYNYEYCLNYKNYIKKFNNDKYIQSLLKIKGLKEKFLNNHPVPILRNTHTPGICFLNAAIHTIYSFKCSKYFLENDFAEDSLEYELKIIFSKMTFDPETSHDMYLHYKNLFYKKNDDLEKQIGGITMFVLVEIFSTIIKQKKNMNTVNDEFIRLFKGFYNIFTLDYYTDEIICRKVYEKCNNIPIFFNIFDYSHIKAVIYSEIESNREPAYIIPFSFYVVTAPRLNKETWNYLIQPIEYKNKYRYLLKAVTITVHGTDFYHSYALTRRGDKWYNVDDNQKSEFIYEFSSRKIIENLFYELD